MKKKILKWAFTGVGGALAAVFVSIFLQNPAKTNAQTINGDSNTGNTQIHGDNNTIHNNHINLTIEKQNSKLSSDIERQLLKAIGEILSDLKLNGEVELTDQAATRLLERTANAIASSPLTRNVVYKRQFDLPVGKTLYIYGTSNRITFKEARCAKGTGYKFDMNGSLSRCHAIGDRIGKDFKIDDKYYYIIFDGSKNDGKIAEITVHQR